MATSFATSPLIICGRCPHTCEWTSPITAILYSCAHAGRLSAVRRTSILLMMIPSVILIDLGSASLLLMCRAVCVNCSLGALPGLIDNGLVADHRALGHGFDFSDVAGA